MDYEDLDYEPESDSNSDTSDSETLKIAKKITSQGKLDPEKLKYV